MAGPSIVIVGAGVMGELHAGVVASQRGASLATIVDLDADRARSLANDHDVAASTDAEVALAAADACVIATPEPSHAALLEVALDADCPTLLEKPIAAEPRDAERIRDLADAAGQPILPGHLLRFDPRYARVRAAVAADEFGYLVSASARRAIPRTWSERMGDRVHPVKQIGTHDVDLLNWLVPTPITRVQAMATERELSDLGVPDAVHATLSFASGVTASIETIGLWPDAFPAEIDARMELVGSTGGTTIRLPGEGFQVATDELAAPNAAYWPSVHGQVTGALRTQFEHFLDCVDGADPAISVAEAYRAFEVTQAIQSALDTDGPVDVAP